MAQPLSAFQWIRNAYFRAALIPLLLAEVFLLAAFIVTNHNTFQENSNAINALAETELVRRAERESALINQQLITVKANTLLLQQKALRAHNTPFFSEAEANNNQFDPSGTALYSQHNISDTALYYTGQVTVGKKEQAKANQLSQLDAFMVDLNRYNELVLQVYYCTFDSMVRITPFLDVLNTFPLKMNLPEFKFYFEADAKNNPERKSVWTRVYKDMAGLGWMVSNLAPVYRNNFLEGVVAQDVTVDALILKTQSIQLPWNGYLLLLDDMGRIMAIPEAHKAQWQLESLVNVNSAQQGDALSQESFNIHRRKDTQLLSEKMQALYSGVAHVDLKGTYLMAWSTIPETDWKLIIVADKASILAPAKALSERSYTTFYIMLGVLFIFYFAFFDFLYIQAKTMSNKLSKALLGIRKMTKAILTNTEITDAETSSIIEVDDALKDLESLGQYLKYQHDQSEK